MEQARRERRARARGDWQRAVGLGGIGEPRPGEPRTDDGGEWGSPAPTLERPPEPTGWRRWTAPRVNGYPNSRLILLAFLVIIVVVALVRGQSSGLSGPAVTADCTHPGLALSDSTVPRGKVVRYAAVGPSGPRYVLTLDASAVSSTGSSVTATAQAGSSAQVLPSPGTLGGCKSTGAFTVTVGSGDHVVSLFRLDSGRGTLLVNAPLTVNSN